MDPNFPSLDTLKEWSAILAAHQWPLLILLVLLVFKKELVALLHRIIKYEGFGQAIHFGEARIDSQIVWEASHPEPKAEPLSPPAKPEAVVEDWGKIKNAFYLAYHLTWTMDVILRGGPPAQIRYGFIQALIFIRELNLLRTSFGQRFLKLSENAETILSKELTRADREALVDELNAIGTEFAVVSAQKIASQRSSAAKKNSL